MCPPCAYIQVKVRTERCGSVGRYVLAAIIRSLLMDERLTEPPLDVNVWNILPSSLLSALG